MAPRTTFEELPSAVRAAIESHTGRIHSASPVASGFNSQLAIRLRCDAGDVHVKGLRSDHRRAWTQGREAEVNPYLKDISPELLWRVKGSGWDLLGFDHIAGHHADYGPESPDLSRMVHLLGQLNRVQLPPVELREAGQRLSAYVDPSQRRLFEGDSLLHTDLNNENVLIHGNRAYLVDWAWATKGAPWLDAGYWVLWLMAAGKHSAEQAEKWACQVPSWGEAAPKALEAFALANSRLWHEIGGDAPDSWTSRMIQASEEWLQHRQGLSEK
ncbi:phosphotransferase [Streptomyces sp. NPDC004610]|uniref:phosphotransferase n=1 Tax=unclassified Streptomyces TaxID=2593676 RepID=UPI0033A03C68